MKKTGYIAIIGRPNVGKSTLLNSLIGEKIAIVSNKPQTTRNRILGILTKGENQFVFLDTPGVHSPKTKLGDYMMKSVRSSLAAADAIILIVDAGYPAGEIEKKLIKQIKESELPSMIVFNKIDNVTKEKLAETISEYAKLHNFDAFVPTSALNNKNVDIVLEEAEKFLYESDWIFDEDQITDQPERQIASETIREKLLKLLSDEIPHGTAVDIDSFEETDKLLSIRATIYCEKQSHKGIIVGKNGETLKKIGTYAREDLEKFFGQHVYLNLWVKVKESWRDDKFMLDNLGFDKKDL